MSKKNYLQDEFIAPVKKKNGLKIALNDLSVVTPITLNQSKFFKAYKDSDFFILSGYPGTGKSFISLYKALEEALTENCYRIVIVRSAVPSRDVGALPGSLDEKLEVYELPYKNICANLFNRPDAYDRLKEQKIIQFVSTSYLRSLTFDDSIIIVDEFQNMDIQELDTVATRVGEDSKLILCGDYMQTDLKKSNDKSGFIEFMNIAKLIPNLKHVEFDNIEDICRSGFVKDYIIAKIKSQNV